MIKNRTAILALLTGLNLLNYIDRFVVAAVLKKMQGPPAEGGLDLSNLQGGLLATAFLGGYFVTSPWFGARADRGTRKGLIAFGVAVWSIATVASGLATDFWSLIAARVFVGIGEAAYATLAPTIIDDITPPESKGKALAVFYTAAPVGSALGYLIGGFVEARWGWRTAFLVAGPPGLLLAGACVLIDEPQRKLAAVKGNIRAAFATLARIPLFRRGVLGYCAFTAAVTAFAHWAPKFIAERYPEYLTTETADYYFGLTTVIAGALGTGLGGRWADRAQRGHVVSADTPYDAPENKRGINELLRICSTGMVIAAPLTVAALLMPIPVVFFVLVGFAEIGLFLSTAPVNAIGLRSVPPHMRASAMAAQIFAIHLFGDLWSPSIVGGLGDVFPPVAAMMSVPATFALAAYLWRPRASEAT